ncbi:hypothetical protein V493_05247 [Pseudogymnoascus sp. VKM F-4281 (FW-2241)]|nr:hypothetical protein V493_05247 [Pseudogymnoascus sp. VKM F-4281 (FW-2241)]
MACGISPIIRLGLGLVKAANIYSASVDAATSAHAKLRVGLRIRQWVCESGAGEQQSDRGDESGELHGDLDAAISL